MNTNRAIETSVAFSKDKPLPVNLELGPGERWFVARVLTHQENRAQLNLHRLGFRNFLPRLRRTIRHARKLRDTLNPLFPGYIFIVIDLSKHRWRSINGTFGVASLIMGAEQPMPVPPGVVEALVASCESRGVVRFDDGLEIGQKVRILSGPFAETICRLARSGRPWARSGATRNHGYGSSRPT